MADRRDRRGTPKLAAWGVHCLTASGAAWGLLALLAAIDREWRTALSWLLVAVLVDAVDGPLARLVNVKQVLPEFDGALLDNIVDYFTGTWRRSTCWRSSFQQRST